MEILLGDRLTFCKLCLISKHVYKVSQIKSATLPFEFVDVADFLAVFELLYVFVVGIFNMLEYVHWFYLNFNITFIFNFQSELEIQTRVINKLRLSESVDGTIVPSIRDWIWLPDSVSAWECKEIQNENPWITMFPLYILFIGIFAMKEFVLYSFIIK